MYAAGFREIEFAGFYDKSAAEIGKLVTGIGLSPVSYMPVPLTSRRRATRSSRTQTLRLKYIVCSSPAVSQRRTSPWEERMKAVDLNDWKWNAELFNKFGKQVSAAGMTFGYHNHSAEFKKFDGKTAFDHLFGMTDPAHVKSELDVGWVTVAQQDPSPSSTSTRTVSSPCTSRTYRSASRPTRILPRWRWAKASSTGREVIGTQGQWHQGVLLRRRSRSRARSSIR